MYQEGDAWGGNKRLPASSRSWLRAADAVFSVAGGAQLAMLRRIAGKPVRYVPHTLPLDCFPEQDRPAPAGDAAVFDVVTIGNSVVRARILPACRAQASGSGSSAGWDAWAAGSACSARVGTVRTPGARSPSSGRSPSSIPRG